MSSLTQGAAALGAGIRRKQTNRAYQSAYMGDPGAMETLAGQDPQLARQLQADIQKRKDVSSQQQIAKQAQLRKRGGEFAKEYRTVAGDLSKFASYEESVEFGQRQKDLLIQRYPEVTRLQDFNAEYTEQDYNEAKTVNKPKSTGFQSLVDSWKSAEEGSEEKKLFEQKLRKEVSQSGGITVSPDGTVQIGGLAPEKPIKRAGQERIISAGESLARLDRIKKNYDPAFLTYEGKVDKGIASIKSKLGRDLNKEDKAMLRQHRKFSQGVNAEFNSYRKLITGAAAAVQELEDLKKAMISTDLSPDEFEAAFNEYSMELSRTLRIRNKLLREGLKPGTKQYGDDLDRMYLTGDDDAMDSRGDELEASGMSDEDIVSALEKEGYL